MAEGLSSISVLSTNHELQTSSANVQTNTVTHPHRSIRLNSKLKYSCNYINHHKHDMHHRHHHHFWHAPLDMYSAKRRHQSPEWTILSYVNCFNQGQVTGF